MSLPGTYQEKIGSLGDSLKHFTRLKSLDLSRNAIESLAVCTVVFDVLVNFISPYSMQICIINNSKSKFLI